MTGLFKNIFSSFLGKNPSPVADNIERLAEYEQIFKLAKKKNLTDEKKAELELLYIQLIKKSDNATSGQLQFLGLDEVKEKIGKVRWPKLQSKVYATAEAVIQRHITLSDIHFLFKEDRYVIIFTQSTDEEIERKVGLISNEIMFRLAELDEEELQFLQVKQEIKKIDVNTFLESDFHDMLDFVFKQYNSAANDMGNPELEALPELRHYFLPLWEADKKALTAHFCLAEEDGGKAMPYLEAYKILFQGKPFTVKAALDIKVLERAIEELEKMELEGRKTTLLCPVQHETLYNFTSYDEYKNVCQTIPNDQRDCLIFVVTNGDNSLPAKDTYWFIPLLKDYCASVFVDIPMRETMPFHSMKTSGAQGMGVQLSAVYSSEDKNLSLLAGFNAQAKYFKMKKTFALNIETETALKKLTRAGFNYLGGPLIAGLANDPSAETDPAHQAALISLFK